MAKAKSQDGSGTELVPQSEQGGQVVAGFDMTQFVGAMADIESAQQDNISAREIQISRIAIAQPGTPEVAAGQDGWKGGMLFDNQSREILSLSGKAPWMLRKGFSAADLKTRAYLPIVCIFKLPTEYVKWPNKDEYAAGQKGFRWKSLDARDPKVREGMWPPIGTWNVKGEAPPVTEHLNILTMCLDDDGNTISGHTVLTFSRTSYKTGKKLVTQLAQHRLSNIPWWGRVYYLYTESETNDKGTYFYLQFAKGPLLTEVCKDQNQAKNVFMSCLDIASKFSEREEGRGRILQEMYINAAQFDLEPQESGEAVENSASSNEPNF